MEIIALEAQIQALHQAVNGTATTVNTRGDLLVNRLQDIPGGRKERKDTRERTNAQWRNITTHSPIHTLAPFDRDCMTCFSMDPLFDFTIYGMQICHVLTLP